MPDGFDTSVKVKSETREKLNKVRANMELDDGNRRSLDEVVDKLATDWLVDRRKADP
jgi:hypothetical protein